MANVLILIDTLKQGGAERVAATLSRELCDEHNVFISVYYKHTQKYINGGTLINLKTPPSSNIFFKILRMVIRYIKISRIKKEHNIDFSISFSPSAHILNTWSKQKEKVIISTRAYWFGVIKQFPFLFSYEKKIMRFLFKKADGIVTPSYELGKLFNKYFDLNIKLDVIRNPCDIKNINKLSNLKLSDKYSEIFKHPVVLNVARLTPEKGQHYFVKAVKPVLEKHPETKFVIVGKITDLQVQLKLIIKELGLKAYWANNSAQILDNKYQIYFLGNQENPFNFIKSSKVFALPSIYEGLPNVLIEAMACGTPIVAADCLTGPKEILTDENLQSKCGILTPNLKDQSNNEQLLNVNKVTNEEDMFNNSIIELLNSEKLRTQYIEKGLVRINDFKIKKIKNDWLNYFSESNSNNY